MAKLTDKQRKRLIADRADGMTIRQLARKYNTSTTTVQATIKRNPDIAQMISQKKDENTSDILAYMDQKKNDVCEIIGLYLEHLKNPTKLNKTSIQSLAISLGIIIDKFTATAQNDQSLKKLDSLMDEIGGVI